MKFHLTFILIFRILYNKVCISYIVCRISYIVYRISYVVCRMSYVVCRMENGIFCLRLIWPVAVPGKVLHISYVPLYLRGFAAISQLCKTKPIYRGLKLTQSHYLQRIMRISCSMRAKKTKPIAGLWPEIRSTNHEIRNELKGLFEKTNPIFERVK